MSSILDYLYDDIYFHILSYLSYKDIIRFSMTCKYTLIFTGREYNSLWLHIMNKEFNVNMKRWDEDRYI